MAPKPDTAVVWFRRDLRVHDHPALAEAVREFDRVVPLFVFDDKLLEGRFRSLNRTAWMLDCLRALDGELRDRGGRLVVRRGAPRTEVRSVAKETGASAVYVSDDVTGFARARDEAVAEALERDGVELRRRPGLYIADLDAVRTKQGKPYTVFTPFLRTWRQQPRRDVVGAPRKLTLPRIARGELPSLKALGFPGRAPELEDRPEPGEAAARRAASAWLRSKGLQTYADGRDTLAQPTSRMSAYLRFGVLSPLWLERKAADRDGAGADGYRTELAWRDFYGAVQLHFPETARHEFQERYRRLSWDHDAEQLKAWRDGETGYPVVDAAMRELRACGWMHNRGRMIVGSFLTKDLGEDWRAGEAHFMEHLIDGDVGSNNGGWQWIASTGTDPAPYFQRLFNPTTQQEKFDPDGVYVRRWVPELRDVPDERLAEPWTMSDEEQEAAGCVIGRDYPAPIVDHAQARRRAIERYREVS